jgi:hypothetical protein
MTDRPEFEPAFLRHVVATLAYRGGKVVSGVPGDFATRRFGETTRTPIEILAHVNDLLDWALSLVQGAQKWHSSTPGEWNAEASRFFAGLGALDQALAETKLLGAPAERLFQGPLADAHTHVGQIALLRRMAGSPIRGENYFVADIAVGNVGPDFPPARREFD